MSTGSFIEMFMTTFGWHLYEIVWGVISSTGLAYLPFFAVIIDNIIKPIESQEAKAAATTSLRRLEVDIIRLIVMMILAVSPYMTIKYGAISHTEACQADTGTPGSKKTAGDSGTVFDDVFKSSLLNNQESKAPPWFYIVMSVSGGINDAVITRLPCDINFRQAEYELSTLKITDPHLKRETLRFVAECHKYATADFYNNRRELPEGMEMNDIDWPGSKYFNDNFYPNEYAKNPVPGFAFNPTRESDKAHVALNENTKEPEFGYPSCHEWWNDSSKGLRKRLIEEVPSNTRAKVRGFFNLDTTSADNDAIRVALRNEGPSMTEGLAIGAGSPEHSMSAIFNIGDWWNLLGDIAGGAGALLTSALLKPVMFMVKQIAPFIQATMLMATYFLLPWVLLVGNYSWSTIKTATITIFAVKFWTTIWAVIDLLDNLLIQTLRQASGHTGFAALKFESVMLGAIIDIVILTLYMGLPFYFLSILGWGGERGASAATQSSNSLSGQAQSAGQQGASTAKSAATSAVSK